MLAGAFQIGEVDSSDGQGSFGYLAHRIGISDDILPGAILVNDDHLHRGSEDTPG